MLQGKELKELKEFKNYKQVNYILSCEGAEKQLKVFLGTSNRNNFFYNGLRNRLNIFVTALNGSKFFKWMQIFLNG